MKILGGLLLLIGVILGISAVMAETLAKATE